MLKIENLNVFINKKEILKDFNLNINVSEVHALMGPNGIGKSTICKTIMGDPNYEITSGNIIYKGELINNISVDERAKKGIYYLNQSPISIEGVTNAEMLRLALAERTNTNVNIFEFNKKMENICQKLDIPKSFIHRGINEGMSGGERKKNELLHLWMLEPSLIILDELDSGLDVDSLKIVCSSINEYKQEHDCAILLVSHHAELLKLLNVTHTHIISNGHIVKTGDYSLALEIEKNGYKEFTSGNVVSDK